MKDINYWKNNAKENYKTTPISVLRYITELEKEAENKQLSIQLVSNQRELLLAFAEHLFEGHDKEVEARIVDDYLKSK